MSKTVWEQLSKIDVSDHVEKKNGMTYLSWAWAWRTLKEHFPDATFRKHVNDDGYPCFMDANGNAFVSVKVIVAGEEQTETFPVLDFKNRGVQNPDAFQVNTALQRCLTKAIGYLGLGFYIYAGEDLPASDDAPVKPAQAPRAQAKSPEAVSSPTPVSGATTPRLSEQIASASSQKELMELYNASKSTIESMDAAIKAQVIAAFSNRKAEMKGA